MKVVLYAPKREVGVAKPQLAFVSKVHSGAEIANKLIPFALGYGQLVASRNPMIVSTAFLCHSTCFSISGYFLRET